MIATKPISENNNEAMAAPQTTHFMSRYSLKHRKNDITSPPGPGNGITTPFDAIAMARVYKNWTGSDHVPWMPRQQHEGADDTPVPATSSRTSQGNALYRLNRDISTALLNALSPEQEGQMIPFSGKTVNLKCGNASKIRLLVVFWSPSYWAATGQSILEEDSSENNMVNLIRRFMKKHNVDVILSIAYVLPRWIQTQNDPPRKKTVANSSNTMAFPSKFLTTAPGTLAYGLWQLGALTCMLSPDAVMSTSGDVARMVGCTGGMEVDSVCTEKAKAVVGSLQSLRRDAVSKLPTIHRDLVSQRRNLRLCHGSKGSLARLTGHNICHIKHPNHSNQAATQHLRCPHPYLLTRDLDPLQPNDALRQRDDQACFVSVMKNLADIATARSSSATTTTTTTTTLGEPKHKKQKCI